MSFIDHISPAPILDPHAPVMDARPKSTVLDRNAARADYADDTAKTGAYVSTNWLLCSRYYYKYRPCVPVVELSKAVLIEIPRPIEYPQPKSVDLITRQTHSLLLPYSTS